MFIRLIAFEDAERTCRVDVTVNTDYIADCAPADDGVGTYLTVMRTNTGEGLYVDIEYEELLSVLGTENMYVDAAKWSGEKKRPPYRCLHCGTDYKAGEYGIPQCTCGKFNHGWNTVAPNCAGRYWFTTGSGAPVVIHTIKNGGVGTAGYVGWWKFISEPPPPPELSDAKKT